MSTIILIGLIVVFFVLQALVFVMFNKNIKIAEVLNITAFLLCAWLITEDSGWISLSGWILVSVAIILDLYRRKILLQR